MPPTAGRPYQVELLLCGHHFRLSEWTLAAAGAEARVIPGTANGRVSELTLP